MTNRSTALFALFLLAACGGSGTSGGTGSATVTGTAGGLSIPAVAEAVSIQYAGQSCSNASQQQAGVVISLSSVTGSCAAAQTGGKATAGTHLLLIVDNVGSSAQAQVTPGTYNVSLLSSPVSIADISKVDANGCSGNNSYLSGSGSITITSINSGGVSGSYNLTFVDSSGNPNGTLSGTFTAPNCAVDASKVCASSSSSC